MTDLTDFAYITVFQRALQFLVHNAHSSLSLHGKHEMVVQISYKTPNMALHWLVIHRKLVMCEVLLG